MLPNSLNKSKANDNLVKILSFAIPVAVAVLIGLRIQIELGNWTKIVPHIIGILNTSTALSLLIGYSAIKKKNIEGHRKAMKLAFYQGAIFLILYIVYHISNPETPYGGQGFLRPIYYFFLMSHILLSIVVVNLVLKAIYFALSGDISAHKKIVKWTYPIWLYVSVTGVIVYLMIAPYYN